MSVNALECEMQRSILGLLLMVVLVACGQSSPAVQKSWVNDYLDRPELQDEESQAILKQYSHDPLLLKSLQEAYGERPQELKYPQIHLQIDRLDLKSNRLVYIKKVAWGKIARYNQQYAAYAKTSRPFPGLDWSRDGCSAPKGLGLGYRNDFRPACYVHDFAYRNLKVYQRTEYNRKISDQVFHTNMKSICKAKKWYKRPACYVVAYAYYKVVRIGGKKSFE